MEILGFACPPPNLLHRQHSVLSKTRSLQPRRSRPRSYSPVMLSSPSHKPEDAASHSPPHHTSPPLSPEQAADQEVIDAAASEAQSSLEDVGGAVKDDLESVQATTQAYADKLIAEETEALLSRYEEKKDELLASVDDDRRVIEEQMGRIQELAKNGSGTGFSENFTEGDVPLREKALSAAAGLFAIAAVIYAWSGFVQDDSQALQNAGLDAIVAAAAVFFLKKNPSGRK